MIVDDKNPPNHAEKGEESRERIEMCVAISERTEIVHGEENQLQNNGTVCVESEYSLQS